MTTTGLHIHAPKGYFLGQVRGYGCRKWRTVTNPRRTAKAAITAAINAMTDSDGKARAILCAEWYDPIPVMEATRS